MDANHLREQARHYRRLAAGLWDRRMTQALDELAADYDRRADVMEEPPLPHTPAAATSFAVAHRG